MSKKTKFTPTVVTSEKVVEEGIVISKGTRHGRMVGAGFEAALNSFTLGPQPIKNWYWAKVKVPNLDKPLEIKSEYNFSKGTKVRVQYNKFDPKQCELVVDWK